MNYQNRGQPKDEQSRVPTVGVETEYNYVELADAHGSDKLQTSNSEFKYDYVGPRLDTAGSGEGGDPISPYDGLNRVSSSPKSPTYISFGYGQLGVNNSDDLQSPYNQVNRSVSKEKSNDVGPELADAQSYGHLNAASTGEYAYNKIGSGQSRVESNDESGKYGVLTSPLPTGSEPYALFNRDGDVKGTDVESRKSSSFAEPYNQINLVPASTSEEYSQLNH